MQAQTAGTRRFGTHWLVGGALTLALAGSGIAATQVTEIELPWSSSSAPAIDHARPYVRPADRPADGPYHEVSSKTDVFQRPTENRSGHEQRAAGHPGTAVGLNITTINLDRDRADIVSAVKANSIRGGDTTTLYLDLNGSDIPEGNWWGISDDAGSVTAVIAATHLGPDITTLNLDRDGADVSAN